MKKQILILEDLGITKENLNNLTSRFEEYNFIKKFILNLNYPGQYLPVLIDYHHLTYLQD